MSSYKLLTERLPSYLLAEMRTADPAWPLAIIPAVIEACRVAGLVSLGGDLRVYDAQGFWESPNIGVAVFTHELSDGPVEQAAAIALKKFMALGGEREFLREVAAGCPGALDAIARGAAPALYFGWTVRTA
jgi:hypothetical protein